MKKFYIIVLILLACSPTEILSAKKTKKKSYKSTTESTATTTSQPAIIAIEIVDPKANSTSTKQSKRTIDGSLGYGFNNFGTPKYEVYKYSQHDIPPYKGTANVFSGSSDNHVKIQKSVQYSLPAISQQVTASSTVLHPGTTLYSSLSEKGQVSGLRSSLPEAPSFVNSDIPVPVVVLRIYPHQLKDSVIQANLPKSHPYAKSINSLNIQELLLQYIKTLKSPGNLNQYTVNHGSLGQGYSSGNQYSASQGSIDQNRGTSSQYYYSQGSTGQSYGYNTQNSGIQASLGTSGSRNQYSVNPASFGQSYGSSSQSLKTPVSHGQNTYTSNQVYSAPTSIRAKPTQSTYQLSNYYMQDSYQNVPKYQSSNGGTQTYMYYQHSFPQKEVQDYTQQTQYQPQQYSNYNSGVTVEEAPIKYEITNYQNGDQLKYSANSISEQPKASKLIAPAPEPQYYYVQPTAQSVQNSYSTEPNNYYLPVQASQQTKQPAVSEVVASEAPEQQYYKYTESQYSDQYKGANPQYESQNKLLTYENYPTPLHTRVVFRTKTGDVRSPKEDQSPAKEIKTIKIHVPDNIAKVEVQESDRPYYGSESTYSDAKQNTQGLSTDAYQQNEEEDSQNNYYLPAEPLVQQDYYNNENSASETFLNYQNVDVNYQDMAKYFEKRGAMPKYFYQSPDDSEDLENDEKEESTTEVSENTEDIISSYEEAAFPTTSAAPVKKREKSKKIS